MKLVNLPVEEKHTPNIFLDATLVDDRQIFNDTKQIVVPPTKNFLTVDIKPDRAQHQPRDEGTFVVTTKNDKGEPVSAEVALGLVDESVFYIQSDYAGDPRQFYFGTKRQHPIQTQSTMNQKSYAKLVPGDNGQLIDEEELKREKEAERIQLGYDGSGLALKDWPFRQGKYNRITASLALVGVVLVALEGRVCFTATGYGQ